MSFPPSFAPSFPHGSPMPQPGVAAPPAAKPQAARPQTLSPAAPVIRGQAPDEPAPRPAPRPAPVTIPSPEQLGVAGVPAAGGADWTAARQRLQELKAVCFQVENLPGGRCRFICLLPTSQPTRHQRIEAEAATEAEAVRLALERAASVK